MGQKRLKITLTNSGIGCNAKQKSTLDALGLKKLNQTIIKDDTLVIRGMINKLKHLLSVEELDAEEV